MPDNFDHDEGQPLGPLSLEGSPATPAVAMQVGSGEALPRGKKERTLIGLSPGQAVGTLSEMILQRKQEFALWF